jgi:HAD superfamily hydrolase (TIGR01509 family)
MTVPELIIFDCDGVLVDSEPVANRLMAENLTRHGLPMTTAQSMDIFVGMSMTGVEAKARGLGAELPEDWVAGVYRETYAALAQGVDAIPGIADLLDRLDAAGRRYCVASNGSLEKMRITLGGTGLLPRFEARMYSAHELGIAKPDPGLFLHAASAQGVDPSRCLVIEDSASGAEGAARAGMACLGYAPHGDGAALSQHGAIIMRGMNEVATAVELDSLTL